MKQARKHKLMYKISKAYYEDGQTQQQIAQRFGLSRIKVSRLLQRSRDEKIVQITINPIQGSNADLERGIEQTYGLKEAVVVTCAADDEDTIVSNLGTIAAQTLIQCLQGKETVGICWGRSLLSVVDALPKVYLPEIRVVQLVGGLGELDARTHGVELARRMAETFGARLRLLHAPGLVKNKAVRDALVTDPQVADTLALAHKVDVAMVGIGTLATASTLTKAQVLTDEEKADLKARGAMGDIAMRFFDTQGRAVKAKVDKRTIGTELEDIQKIPRVIGVAGGKGKSEVIRAVLKGGLVDVLVTDQYTADTLTKKGDRN